MNNKQEIKLENGKTIVRKVYTGVANNLYIHYKNDTYNVSLENGVYILKNARTLEDVHNDHFTATMDRFLAEIEQEETKQESTEMTHKQMVQEAMTALYGSIDNLTTEESWATNDQINDEIFEMFDTRLSTGEISDIRNELDSKKEHKYNPCCTCVSCEEISSEKERENECLHMRNMRLPIGGYWHNAY